MFNIISLILIILAALVILIIIIKKFPALAILNVTDILGEKETKFKQQIIKSRVQRDLERWSGFLGRFLLFIKRYSTEFLQNQQTNLEKIKANCQANIKIPWSEKQKRIKNLKLIAQESLKKEDDALAEKKLLEIIKLDQKNLSAFFNLAELYVGQKKYLEARETYKYALNLTQQAEHQGKDPEIKAQEVYFALAEMEKSAENLELALEDISEALELEPANPRYLDLILDLSIIMKEKELAEKFWKKLVAVNPENQKLSDLQKQIKKISTDQ